ncbi:MAG: uracil-xanthine permease, partial [Clostridia bacterium]|nr:uracil-xanthine permease [Clostridia bacterium]
MKLVYDINDRPPLKKNLIFALQQLLAIMAATLLVPVLVNVNTGANYMSQPAALLGAGFGTLFYILMTKGKSPVFLGSSFAFIAPLGGAVAFGYLGIFLGAVFAGLVYVAIALVVKKTGSGWVNKLLPPVVIGPTVALIGLSLCGSAVNNMANIAVTIKDYNLVYILVAVIAFFITVYASTKGTTGMKLIPFVIGNLGAYVIALALTGLGYLFNCDYIKLVKLSAFEGMQLFEVPKFTFLGMFEEGASKLNGISGILNILLLFAPVALVVLAEHIADHKNLSSIIDRDLITEPGLHRTLIGDGVGSIIGSFFGGCPNTTYGESVGCVAITG